MINSQVYLFEGLQSPPLLEPGVRRRKRVTPHFPNLVSVPPPTRREEEDDGEEGRGRGRRRRRRSRTYTSKLNTER